LRVETCRKKSALRKKVLGHRKETMAGFEPALFDFAGNAFTKYTTSMLVECNHKKTYIIILRI
jgi:hypothetical protein